MPKAEAALVSLQPEDGALRALVGGLSFSRSKFNRATQAQRQPGSSFKPFLYSAAFERGYTPASIVLDAPVVFRDRVGHVWRPQNDNGKFSGPMRMREALVRSRNLVSVRLLDAIGVDFARKYITQFGFKLESLPPNLSMSLGTASLTPMSVARGYAVFANGGFLVEPYFIARVLDRNGVVDRAARTRRAPAGRARSAWRARRARRWWSTTSTSAPAAPPRPPAGRGRGRPDGGRPAAGGAGAARDRRAHRVPDALADARRGAARHRDRGARCSSAPTSAARPAPPTTIATPGSPASAATW